MEGSGSFLRPMIPESWKFFQNQLRSFQEKIYTQIEEDLNNFLSRNMGFQHPKIKKKKTVSCTMTITYIQQKLKVGDLKLKQEN